MDRLMLDPPAPLLPARQKPAKQKPRQQRSAVYSRRRRSGREGEQVEGTLVRGADWREEDGESIRATGRRPLVEARRSIYIRQC